MNCRRYFRFSLRRMLLVVLVLSLPMTWLAREAHVRRSQGRMASTFVRLATAGRTWEAASLWDPRLRAQMDDIAFLAGKQLLINEVHRDGSTGFALTNELQDDRGRRGRLVLHARERQGLWWLTDIDFDVVGTGRYSASQ